jgi:hypothetical protein
LSRAGGHFDGRGGVPLAVFPRVGYRHREVAQLSHIFLLYSTGPGKLHHPSTALSIEKQRFGPVQLPP